MRAKLADKGNWFRNIAGAVHRNVEWRAVLGVPTVALAREARIADLVVVGQQAASADIYNALDPGRVVLWVGRPTIVVPKGVTALRADHIVIGWKDTREARRVVRRTPVPQRGYAGYDRGNMCVGRRERRTGAYG